MEVHKTDHTTIKYLAVCCLISAMLCVAQIFGSSLLIAGVLLLFLLMLCFSVQHDRALSVLLFFLPWSPLMKLVQGSISFYTIGLLLVCLLYFLRSGLKLDPGTLITALLITDFTLLAKFLQEYSFDLSYIMFIFLLVLFPMVVLRTIKSEDLHSVTFFFAMGIIIAALSAKYLVAFPNIARYIDIYSWNIVTRRSGYYGDPNFYSAHISAALAGTLLLILKERKKGRIFLYAVLTLALLYCGLLSASKAFMITIVLVFALWFLELFLMKNKVSFKIMILIGFLALVVFVSWSGLFTEALKVLEFRFGQSSDLSGLTTGRTERWLLYFDTIFDNVRQFMLGAGFTNIKLSSVSPHNTILQILFQFGAIGTVVLIFWLLSCYKQIRGFFTKNVGWINPLLLLIGAFLPWMALDMLFFDEFFLIPLYAVIGFKYLGAPAQEGDQ